MVETNTENDRSIGTKKSRWIFFSISIVALLLILIGASFPFIQNELAIRKLVQHGGFYGTKPGCVMRSLPGSWETWLRDSIKPRYLRPFDTVFSISFDSVKTFHNDDLKTLSPFENIEFLDLENINLTDEGLKHLVELKSIYHLELAASYLTDDGLKTLEDFKHLKHLTLYHMDFSDEAKERLNKALPECNIVWD